MTIKTTTCLVLFLLGLAIAAPYKENDDGEVDEMLPDLFSFDRDAMMTNFDSSPKDLFKNPLFLTNVTDRELLDRSAVVDNTDSDPMYQRVKAMRAESYADQITDETSVRDFAWMMESYKASVGGFMPLADNDPDTIVDVSIRFWPTTETVVKKGGENGVKQYAQFLVDKTNEIFQNSGVKIHLTTPCVTRHPISFGRRRGTWEQLMGLLRCRVGREQHGVRQTVDCSRSDFFMQTNDLSVLLIDSNRMIRGDNANAIGMSGLFEVLFGRSDIVIEAGYNSWILAHEIGHHMGLEHGAGNTAFPYAGSVYGSVMNPAGPGNSKRPHRFSSSVPSMNGVSPIGDEDHDNVRQLNRLRFILARSGNEGVANPKYPCM